MYEEHKYTSLRVQPTFSIQVGMDLNLILFFSTTSGSKICGGGGGHVHKWSPLVHTKFPLDDTG